MLKGSIIEKMFIGESYRYAIRVGDYEVFADTDESIDGNEVYLGLSKEKIYMF